MSASVCTVLLGKGISRLLVQLKLSTRLPPSASLCSLHLTEATSYMNTHEQPGALPTAPLQSALYLLFIPPSLFVLSPSLHSFPPALLLLLQISLYLVLRGQSMETSECCTCTKSTDSLVSK